MTIKMFFVKDAHGDGIMKNILGGEQKKQIVSAEIH